MKTHFYYVYAGIFLAVSSNAFSAAGLDGALPVLSDESAVGNGQTQGVVKERRPSGVTPPPPKPVAPRPRSASVGNGSAQVTQQLQQVATLQEPLAEVQAPTAQALLRAQRAQALEQAKAAGVKLLTPSAREHARNAKQRKEQSERMQVVAALTSAQKLEQLQNLATKRAAHGTVTHAKAEYDKTQEAAAAMSRLLDSKATVDHSFNTMYEKFSTLHDDIMLAKEDFKASWIHDLGGLHMALKPLENSVVRLTQAQAIASMAKKLEACARQAMQDYPDKAEQWKQLKAEAYKLSRLKFGAANAAASEAK